MSCIVSKFFARLNNAIPFLTLLGTKVPKAALTKKGDANFTKLLPLLSALSKKLGGVANDGVYPENLSSPVTFFDLGFSDGSPTLLISNTGLSAIFISVTLDGLSLSNPASELTSPGPASKSD